MYENIKKHQPCMAKGGQLMKIQFNSRSGAIAVNNGYIVRCIPWKNGSGEYYMWNITIQKAGEHDLTDVEVYCRDIPMLKMEEMFEWLTTNTEATPDEISQYIKKKLPSWKCNVYKITKAGDSSGGTIMNRSKGAGTPVLEYPGTRLDEIAD